MALGACDEHCVPVSSIVCTGVSHNVGAVRLPVHLALACSVAHRSSMVSLNMVEGGGGSARWWAREANAVRMYVCVGAMYCGTIGIESRRGVLFRAEPPTVRNVRFLPHPYSVTSSTWHSRISRNESTCSRLHEPFKPIDETVRDETANYAPNHERLGGTPGPAAEPYSSRL